MFTPFIRVMGTIAVVGLMQLAAVSAVGPSVWAWTGTPEPTRGVLKIERVTVIDGEFDEMRAAGLTVLRIDGKHLYNGRRLVVRFGGDVVESEWVSEGKVDGSAGWWIRAEIPGSLPFGQVEPGDYRVQVRTGPYPRQYDTYDLTFGAVASEDPPGTGGGLPPDMALDLCQQLDFDHPWCDAACADSFIDHVQDVLGLVRDVPETTLADGGGTDGTIECVICGDWGFPDCTADSGVYVGVSVTYTSVDGGDAKEGFATIGAGLRTPDAEEVQAATRTGSCTRECVYHGRGWITGQRPHAECIGPWAGTPEEFLGFMDSLVAAAGSIGGPGCNLK